MGSRKQQSAAARREVRQARSYAVLRNCPISARKVRLVANMIRGEEVNRALGLLRYAPQGSAPHLEKLLLSALANWGQKHPEAGVEEAGLVVQTIMVDEGRTLKRIRPRAQGRANRILKRSSHITIEVGERPQEPDRTQETAATVATQNETE